MSSLHEAQARQDASYMDQAIRLARQGLGRTAPNPSVGAIIVEAGSGTILARARTADGGRPHAERRALDLAGQAARGATMYVSLEPCAHFGHSPPCVDAIIEAGIARVVWATGDPDARVAGQGLARLSEVGVEVAGPVREAEARWATLGHLMRVTRRRPFIQLKLALGSDDRVPSGTGETPTWITGPVARAHGHLFRAQADAILVGIETVLADDPALTCRLPGLQEASPIRIVLDSSLRLPLHSQLIRTAHRAPVWLIHGEGAARDRLDAVGQTGARTVCVPRAPSGRLDLTHLAETLAQEGITRLLVEGGPTVAGAFLAADLVDELVLFQSDKAVGPGGLDVFGGEPLPQVLMAARLMLGQSRRIGTDNLTRYRRMEFAEPCSPAS